MIRWILRSRAALAVLILLAVGALFLIPADRVAGLLEDRLRIRGAGLAAKLKSGGRRLPRRSLKGAHTRSGSSPMAMAGSRWAATTGRKPRPAMPQRSTAARCGLRRLRADSAPALPARVQACLASPPGLPAWIAGTARRGRRCPTWGSTQWRSPAASPGSAAMPAVSAGSASPNNSQRVAPGASGSSVGRNFGGVRALLACS